MNDKSQHACGIIHDRHWPGSDASGCYLPDGHPGPHEYKDEKGNAWCWETDFDCPCPECRCCEGDYCTEYWPKGQEHVQQ